MLNRRSRVKFQEETYVYSSSRPAVAPPTDFYFCYTNTTSPAAAPTDSYSSYSGPRFPNLQKIFKHRNTPSFEEGIRREEEVITAPVLPPPAATVVGNHGDDVVERIRDEALRNQVAHQPPATRQVEDVNLEADEFIKRKHKNFEQQKLMSMKAAAA